MTLAKAASTPADPSLGVMEGLERLAEALGMDRRAMLGQTARIVHGTTVATNALLERKGAKVGLLTTEGHRDVLEMREGLKDDRYDLRQPPPEPLVPRELRLAVRERMRADGRIETPLDQRSLDDAIAALREARVGFGRGLLPARLARRPARAADGRCAARGAARGARLALLRGAAADQGVRAGLHHRGQRLCRPGAGGLSRPPGDAPSRGGLCRPDPDHAVARRRRDDRRQRAPRRGCGALGPGGRRRRRLPRERR